MAQVMYCDGCAERPGVVMIQNLTSPEPLVFCPWCSIEFMEGFVAATKLELGITSPADDGSAVSGELGASGDTLNTGITRDGSGDPAVSPADNAQPEGGDDSGSVPIGDRGPTGGDPDGAGEPGSDLSGAGGPGSGAGDGAGNGAVDGADAAGRAQRSDAEPVLSGPQ